MRAKAAQPTLLGRAARMLLVFLLVFGTSFRVEMALAAGVAESGLDDHEKGTLVDLTVCKVVGDSVDVKDGAVRSLVNMSKKEKGDGFTLAYGDSVKLAAAPKWKGENLDASAAKYVEWKVNGGDASGPVIEIVNDGSLGASAEVTCTVSEKAQPYLSDDLAKTTSITFPIAMEAKPLETHQVVGNMNCLLTGDGLVEGENSLTLTLDQGKSYQFIAKVTAEVNTVDSDDNIVSTDPFAYSSDSGTTLSEASGGLFADLAWELLDDKQPLDPDIASIDNGVLSVSKDCSFIVQCTLADAAGKNLLPFQMSVTCGDPSKEPDPDEPGAPDGPEPQKADQGDDHHQDSLRVIGRVPVAAMTEEAAASDGSSEASDSAEGGEPGESTEAEAGVEAADDGSSDDSTSSSGGESDQVKELDRTYSLDEIEALGSSQETYGLSTAAAGEITVTGEGPALEALFKSMGIENLEAINEIKFTDYALGEVTVSWSALSDAMLAVRSYVHDPESVDAQEGEAATPEDEVATPEGEGGGEVEDGTAEGKTELLDNTRFRILANGLATAGIDADSLRWISEIEINPGKKVEPEPEPEPEPDPEAPFSVQIGYAPSPIGEEAVFWPIPSKEIAGATFDYVWEESSDDKKTWEKVSENPTYRTITTEERVGHWFRVTLSSDMIDEATGKPLKAHDEVQMTKGWGISLVFDPPVAGDVATFTVKFAGFPSGFDPRSLDYIWELSTDGCETWQQLVSQYQGKSTLSIQTDPIDENDSKANVTPAYIRCRVVGEALKPITDTTAEIAGPQMLTVHTGDSSDGGSKAPENAKPAKIVKDDSSKDDSGKNDNRNKDEEDEFFTDGSEFEDGDGDDDESATTPSADGAPVQSNGTPQLHINDAVSEQIREQEEAVQERIEETVPGARWTALNTMEASSDDIQNVLADNPFAPFAIPVGLGITIAGGLEKLLLFRRQL